MLLFLSLFTIICCLKLLEIYPLSVSTKDYAKVSRLEIRYGSPISMWTRYFRHNQSDEINGVVVDTVNERHVKDHYAYLLQTREKNFEDAFVRRSSSTLSKLYREYAYKVNTILEHQNSTSLAKQFQSLRYYSSGETCDGCFLKKNIKPFARVPKNELLLRKFVGNRETLEIYYPNKRKNGQCM